MELRGALGFAKCVESSLELLQGDYGLCSIIPMSNMSVASPGLL